MIILLIIGRCEWEHELFDLEATYNFLVDDNLSIIPAFYYINNPNNFEDNPDIYVGNVRMQFKL